MFAIDERIRGLPANREQVVALHQSLNAPHLAIPGKQAGPAHAYIVGLKGASGHAVFVYLFLSEVGDCAVYVSPRRSLPAEAFEAEENEALAFVESMGFMMDNANFTSLPVAQQDELIKTLPVFRRDPKLAPQLPGATMAEPKSNPAVSLGKILSAF